jgi:Mg-chelatase subunit ChlD
VGFPGRSILTLLLLTPPALAGNGTFAAGVYSFCVSVRFKATPAQLANVQAAFAAANHTFADALDGQQRFGAINLVNNSGCSDAAEFWINPGDGHSYATFGQYGVRGRHVMLYYNGLTPGGPDDFTTPAGGVAYLIAHHMMHHSFNLRDEYTGPGGAAYCARPPDTPALNYSLMDNFFVRGGRASSANYTLKELCVHADHDPDGLTWQTAVNHQSAWETVAAHPTRAATAPIGLPNPVPPTVPDPVFSSGATGLRVILLIDASATMGEDSQLAFAQQAAALFVQSLQPGDQVGVVAYDESPTLVYPLTAVVDASTQAAIIAAIDNIQVGGAPDPGDALAFAIGQITAGPRSCNELIVMLAGGGAAVGPDLSKIAAQGITIFTAGTSALLPASTQSALAAIASQSGGTYYGLHQPFALIGTLFQSWAEASGNGLAMRAAPAQGAATVPVESGAQALTIGISFADATAGVTITVRAPDGSIVAPAAHSIANALLYQATNPQPGNWQVSLTPTSATNVEVFAATVNPAVKLMLSAATSAISATPVFGGANVINASISGIVTRPDGSTVPLTLADNIQPGSGVYTTNLASPNANGTYTVRLTAAGPGALAQGESFGTTLPAASPAPQFTRVSSASFAVTGLDPCAAPITPIAFNVPVTGSLTSLSCLRNGVYTALYGFTGTAGQPATISLSSADFDAYLYLFGPAGNVVASDDDSGGGTNSRIQITLPSSGLYTVWATSYNAGLGPATGAFTLLLAGSSAPCTYSLAPAAVSAPAVGAAGAITVSTGFGCPWSYGTLPSWIALSLTGPAGAAYSIAPNYGAARSATILIAGQTFTVTQAAAAAGAPTAVSVAPSSVTATSQTLTVTFNDPAGWQALSAVNVLIQTAINGVGACYLAFVPSGVAAGSLFLVDDAGDSGGPFAGMLLPGTQTIQNSQCSISATGSSVTAAGTTLTLTLAISLKNFGGNKVIYAAAREAAGQNSGWQALGTWAGAVNYPGPGVIGLSGNTITFSDPNGWQDLRVLNVLVNNAIDGAHACYLAFVPSSATAGSLYLVDDAGDAGGPYQGLTLPGSGTIQSSQCAINAAGSSVGASATTLSLALAITYQPAFAGNQVIYAAARSNSLTSGWQAVGIR